jgi:hypothetical protein
VDARGDGNERLAQHPRCGALLMPDALSWEAAAHANVSSNLPITGFVIPAFANAVFSRVLAATWSLLANSGSAARFASLRRSPAKEIIWLTEPMVLPIPAVLTRAPCVQAKASDRAKKGLRSSSARGFAIN